MKVYHVLATVDAIGQLCLRELPFNPGDRVKVIIKEHLDLFRSRCNERVLLLEDDPMVLELTSEMLKDMGFAVESHLVGEDVVEAYKFAMNTPQAFKLVLLDIVNNISMDGRMAMEQLKELDPQVRAVAISGYLHDYDTRSLLELGFMAVIPKPFKIDDLQEAIKKVLNY